MNKASLATPVIPSEIGTGGAKCQDDTQSGTKKRYIEKNEAPSRTERIGVSARTIPGRPPNGHLTLSGGHLFLTFWPINPASRGPKPKAQGVSEHLKCYNCLMWGLIDFCISWFYFSTLDY